MTNGDVAIGLCILGAILFFGAVWGFSTKAFILGGISLVIGLCSLSSGLRWLFTNRKS